MVFQLPEPRHHRINTQAVEIAGKTAANRRINQGQNPFSKTTAGPLANGLILGQGPDPEIGQNTKFGGRRKKRGGKRPQGLLRNLNQLSPMTEVTMKISQRGLLDLGLKPGVLEKFLTGRGVIKKTFC